MVSSTELRDRRAGETGAQPCDGKEAELRILMKTEDTIKVLGKLTVRVTKRPQIPMYQLTGTLVHFYSLDHGAGRRKCSERRPRLGSVHRTQWRG